jgi:hypothetical protein
MFDKAIYVLAVAAVVGVYMAIQHSKGKSPPPTAAAVLHGLLAVAGVVLVLLGVMQGASKMHVWALALFVVAALGGLYLVSHHIRKRPLPGGVIAIHGVVAATGFVLLVLAVFVLS